MEPRSEPANTIWPFPFTLQDWEQTPPAVQAYLRTVRDELGQLQDRVETLEARLRQDSTTSHRPPSSDSPYKKPRLRTAAATPRKVGGKPGHPGHRQMLLPSTTVQELRPERCLCGNTTLTLTTPYHTHQVLELPPIAMEVTHWVLHQSWCPDCGRWCKAQVPAEHATGYGPRFSALMGELAGAYGNGRRIVQTFCASVLRVSISLGAIQKVLDRVAQAIDPYYALIAQQARQAPVNYIDETPWYCLNMLEWLWVMANEQVPLAAKQMIGAQRAFVFGGESRYRLPELALLAGNILAYVAATAQAVATGFWDRHCRPTCGRLRRVLLQVHFADIPVPAGSLRKKASVTIHLPKGVQGHRRRKGVLTPPVNSLRQLKAA